MSLGVASDHDCRQCPRVITTAVGELSAVSAVTTDGTRLYDGTGGATAHTSTRRDWRRDWRSHDAHPSTDTHVEHRDARRLWALRMPSTQASTRVSTCYGVLVMQPITSRETSSPVRFARFSKQSNGSEGLWANRWANRANPDAPVTSGALGRRRSALERRPLTSVVVPAEISKSKFPGKISESEKRYGPRKSS
jgi:hypothetical protein